MEQTLLFSLNDFFLINMTLTQNSCGTVGISQAFSSLNSGYMFCAYWKTTFNSSVQIKLGDSGDHMLVCRSFFFFFFQSELNCKLASSFQVRTWSLFIVLLCRFFKLRISWSRGLCAPGKSSVGPLTKPRKSRKGFSKTKTSRRNNYLLNLCWESVLFFFFLNFPLTENLFLLSTMFQKVWANTLMPRLLSQSVGSGEVRLIVSFQPPAQTVAFFWSSFFSVKKHH